MAAGGGIRNAARRASARHGSSMGHRRVIQGKMRTIKGRMTMAPLVLRRMAGPLVVALGAGMWLACNDIEVGDPFGVDALSLDLVGFWQGTAEVTNLQDRVTGDPRTPTAGFFFPVAMQLRPDRSFTLWSVHFPVVGVEPADARATDEFDDAFAQIARARPDAR
jgi:hypothetical protein